MSIIVISIDRSHFPPHTEDEYEAWVKYQVGDADDIDMKNPLLEWDIDAKVMEFG